MIYKKHTGRRLGLNCQFTIPDVLCDCKDNTLFSNINHHGQKKFNRKNTPLSKTEALCKKWPGRIRQRIRAALGILQIRSEPFRTRNSSLPESSLLYQGLCSIAKCNKFRKADTEIAITLQEISPTETVETLTLLYQKQQVCQAVLRTTWSDVDAVTLLTAPVDLIIPLSASLRSVSLVHQDLHTFD